MAGRCELDGRGAADQLGGQSWTVKKCTGESMGKRVAVGGVQEADRSGRGGCDTRSELRSDCDGRGIVLIERQRRGSAWSVEYSEGAPQAYAYGNLGFEVGA